MLERSRVRIRAREVFCSDTNVVVSDWGGCDGGAILVVRVGTNDRVLELESGFFRRNG